MIRKFLSDETGLELSEYAVAAAMIALATVAAFQLLGTSISDKITSVANNVKLSIEVMRREESDTLCSQANAKRVHSHQGVNAILSVRTS